MCRVCNKRYRFINCFFEPAKLLTIESLFQFPRGTALLSHIEEEKMKILSTIIGTQLKVIIAEYCSPSLVAIQMYKRVSNYNCGI